MKEHQYSSVVLNVITNSVCNVVCLQMISTAIEWAPIKNVYSPPSALGHYCYPIPLFKKEVDMISQVIGKDGYHFKRLTDLPGVSYIWYNKETFCIEVWTEYDSQLFPHAVTQVYKHLHYCSMKTKTD